MASRVGRFAVRPLLFIGFWDSSRLLPGSRRTQWEGRRRLPTQRHDFPAFSAPRVLLPPPTRAGFESSTGSHSPAGGPAGDGGQDRLRGLWAQHNVPAWGLATVGEPVSPPCGPRAPTRGSMSRPQGIRPDLHTRPAGHLAGSGRGLRQAATRQLGAGVTSSPAALRRRSAPHPAGQDPPGAPAVPADSAHQTTHDVEDSG